MSDKYVRLCKSVKDFGILVTEQEAQDIVLKDNNKSWYKSTYNYNKNHLDQFKQTGSVKGIRDVTSDKIWFDLDNKENPEQARKDALEVIKRLKDKGIDHKSIRTYFSGNKGVHIIVKLNRELNPSQVANVCKYIGKNIPTLDLSVYDSTQILRVPWTKHEISGKYKIALTEQQLEKLPITEIQKLANSTENMKQQFNSGVAEISDELVTKEEEKKVIKVDTSVKEKPNHWISYKWALLNAVGLKDNERHQALMVLVATLKGLGYPQDIALAMLTTFDEKFQKLTGKGPVEDLETNIMPSVYNDSWLGGQYSYKNDPWLRDYCERIGMIPEVDEDSKVTTIDDLHEGFKDYVKNIGQNTIRTGIPELDERMPVTVGMNLGLLGSASSGKSALAINILKHTSEAGVPSVVASLDMHRNRIFEKLLYKAHYDLYGYTINRNDLYSLFKSEKENELREYVKKAYGNIWFYDRSSPSVYDLRKYIEQVEQTSGKKIKLLVIDYFERISSDISDATASSGKVAGQLQDLLNDMNLAIITLVQPNKFSINGGPDMPLLSYTSIKGSSFLYQSFRNIISIWRPFFTPKTKDLDKFLEMAILKNDLGELDHFKFTWDGATGSIGALTEEDEARYTDFIEKKKEIFEEFKKDEDDDWK